MKYLLDSNSYIQACNVYYSFDTCPAFWEWIDQEFNNGNLASIDFIFKEITSKKDDKLKEWASTRKIQFLKIDDNLTQSIYSEIVNYISTVEVYNKGTDIPRFLSGADPWLIAKAKVMGATVITQEVSVPQESTKIKIPNICKCFEVPFMNTFELIKNLEAQFILKK